MCYPFTISFYLKDKSSLCFNECNTKFTNFIIRIILLCCVYIRPNNNQTCLQNQGNNNNNNNINNNQICTKAYTSDDYD